MLLFNVLAVLVELPAAVEELVDDEFDVVDIIDVDDMTEMGD
jgi:hypothetical protein